MFKRDTSPLNIFTQDFNVLNYNTDKTRVKGIHTPYLYAGMPGSIFGWHVEDCHLFSANSSIDGANKVWYMIPPFYIHNFVQEIISMYMKSKPFKFTTSTLRILILV